MKSKMTILCVQVSNPDYEECTVEAIQLGFSP